MNQWEHEPEELLRAPLMPDVELVGAIYPNLAERVVRVILHVAGIFALILASVLMLALIRFGLNVGDAVDRFNEPKPVTTGCPFGDGECGG